MISRSNYYLGKGVVLAQEQHDLSVAQLATRLGTSRMQVYRYREAKDLKFSKVCQLADTFGMSVESFLELCRQ
jgi:predicted transcriptional regulator